MTTAFVLAGTVSGSLWGLNRHYRTDSGDKKQPLSTRWGLLSPYEPAAAALDRGLLVPLRPRVEEEGRISIGLTAPNSAEGRARHHWDARPPSFEKE